MTTAYFIEVSGAGGNVNHTSFVLYSVLIMSGCGICSFEHDAASMIAIAAMMINLIAFILIDFKF
jgi:hypothetical protein